MGGKTTHPTLLEDFPQPPRRRLTRVITCPRCAVENPEQSRFCNACGASVAPESEPAREVTPLNLEAEEIIERDTARSKDQQAG